jgi:hypothetical protein
VHFRASVDGYRAVWSGERKEPCGDSTAKTVELAYRCNKFASCVSKITILRVNHALQCLSNSAPNLKVLSIRHSEHVIRMACATHPAKKAIGMSAQ